MSLKNLKSKPFFFFALTIVMSSVLSLYPDAAHCGEHEKASQGAIESAIESTNKSASTSAEQKEAVEAWFKKYDQIRCAAELTLIEKFQTMSFLDKNLDNKTVLRKRDQELVARMNAKYAKADEEMKNLQPVAATRELQDGYSNYFGQVHKIFTRYVKDPSVPEVACSRSTVREQRSALEELDEANKKLDAQLRSKFGIAKHKHS